MKIIIKKKREFRALRDQPGPSHSFDLFKKVFSIEILPSFPGTRTWKCCLTASASPPAWRNGCSGMFPGGEVPCVGLWLTDMSAGSLSGTGRKAHVKHASLLCIALQHSFFLPSPHSPAHQGPSVLCVSTPCSPSACCLRPRTQAENL